MIGIEELEKTDIGYQRSEVGKGQRSEVGGQRANSGIGGLRNAGMG